MKEVTIIFIKSTIVCPQVNNRKGTQPHPSTENWIKDLTPDVQVVSEKAEESEIKVPTSAGSLKKKKKRIPEKQLFLLY